jgi:phage terminase large subunit-like protein
VSARHEIAARLNGANRYTLELVGWRARWLETARPKQIPPDGDWSTWLLLAGRGFGKTRPGAEEIGFRAASQPATRWAVAAPTQADVRNVCFEGESGLLAVIPPYLRMPGPRGYSSQALRITLRNGSIIQGYSAEKPDRFRGPQHHGAWCDELASWGASASGTPGKAPSNRLQDAWDNLLLGLRLGKHPRIIATSTPRPIDFLRALIKDSGTAVTKGNTFENAANLAPSALATFKKVFEGTRRGQQELYAEILEHAEGALFSPATIELHRIRDGEQPQFVRIVVAIDPAVTAEVLEGRKSDETGIIVCGLAADGRIYVLDDFSGIYKPRDWARMALSAYERYQADCIVGEINQGGDLIEGNLAAEAGSRAAFAFKGIHAKRGKYLRAEPIAALYEKGIVSHVGHFPALEKQMCNFLGFTGENSPDRLDALVYGVGELALGTATHEFF